MGGGPKCDRCWSEAVLRAPPACCDAHGYAAPGSVTQASAGKRGRAARNYAALRVDSSEQRVFKSNAAQNSSKSDESPMWGWRTVKDAALRCVESGAHKEAD